MRRDLAWAILVPDTLTLINANDRSHWAVRHRKTQELRQYACLTARRFKIPKLTQAAVTVVVHPGVRTKRFDPANWAPSSKALIDGLVDADVLPDDSSKYLVAVTYIAGTRRRKTAVELRITDVSRRSQAD